MPDGPSPDLTAANPPPDAPSTAETPSTPTHGPAAPQTPGASPTTPADGSSTDAYVSPIFSGFAVAALFLAGAFLIGFGAWLHAHPAPNRTTIVASALNGTPCPGLSPSASAPAASATPSPTAAGNASAAAGPAGETLKALAKSRQHVPEHGTPSPLSVCSKTATTIDSPISDAILTTLVTAGGLLIIFGAFYPRITKASFFGQGFEFARIYHAVNAVKAVTLIDPALARDPAKQAALTLRVALQAAHGGKRRHADLTDLALLSWRDMNSPPDEGVGQ